MQYFLVPTANVEALQNLQKALVTEMESLTATLTPGFVLMSVFLATIGIMLIKTWEDI